MLLRRAFVSLLMPHFIMDARVKPGHDGGRLAGDFNCRVAHHRPHFLKAPGTPSSDLARASKNKRVRGTPGSRGTRAPRRLATSRPVEAGSNASPPFSRRSAQRVFWFAPFRPRWTDLFRLPLALGSPFHRCGTLNMARALRQRWGHDVGGPSGARLARRDESGLDRRFRDLAPHLRRPRPATAPRPASEDAVQTPLIGAGCRCI